MGYDNGRFYIDTYESEEACIKYLFAPFWFRDTPNTYDFFLNRFFIHSYWYVLDEVALVFSID